MDWVKSFDFAKVTRLHIPLSSDLFLTKFQLIYKFMLVSGVQDSDTIFLCIMK